MIRTNRKWRLASRAGFFSAIEVMLIVIILILLGVMASNRLQEMSAAEKRYPNLSSEEALKAWRASPERSIPRNAIASARPGEKVDLTTPTTAPAEQDKPVVVTAENVQHTEAAPVRNRSEEEELWLQAATEARKEIYEENTPNAQIAGPNWTATAFGNGAVYLYISAGILDRSTTTGRALSSFLGMLQRHDMMQSGISFSSHEGGFYVVISRKPRTRHVENTEKN